MLLTRSLFWCLQLILFKISLSPLGEFFPTLQELYEDKKKEYMESILVALTMLQKITEIAFSCQQLVSDFVRTYAKLICPSPIIVDDLIRNYY